MMIAIAAFVVFTTFAAETPDPAHEREMRDRYEMVLLRNPFQERAFNSVYEGYLKGEGVDRWIETLKPKADSGEQSRAALLLLGQIYERQFHPQDAIASLERAAAQGEARPEFKALLGSLYYKAGQDERAAELLSASLDALDDLDRRASVCRILGNLYLRQGKRDEAAKVWKRLADQNGDEVFSQLELAEIYEDNRLWDEAIAVYRRIVASAKDDPYRRCAALRSIGQCLVQKEKHREAIAAYEEALGLAAPGNWLFEDLKLRLVGVYEDTGDLAGLTRYLQARVEQSPGDVEFRELLAETYTRMGKLDLAEKEHRAALERSPRAPAIHEKLLALYARQGKTNETIAGLQKLIELFPAETEWVRRLGEAHLRNGDAAKAQATWQRIVEGQPTAERFAELAGWLESFNFPDAAIRAYEQALEKTRNKEWVFRLASLKFERGAEAEALKLRLSVLDAERSTGNDYAEVATILEANRQIEPAASLRKQAAAKEPANLEHRLAYARDLMQLQRFDAALAEYSILAEQNQNDYLKAQGESGLLEAYAELGVLDEKRKEWEQELERDPRSAPNLMRLARVYERTGQREKAVQLLQKRRDLEPDNIESLRALAEACKAAHQTKKAVEGFNELLLKDKGRARVYLKDLLELHLAAESKDEAIAAAEQIVALAPSDPEARLELAQVYVLFQAKEKGFEQYRHALRLAPNEPEYHRHYGEALLADKRWGEAQAAFRKMLDLAQQDQTRLSAVQNLTRIYVQQGAIDELIAEFNRRLRNTPKKLEAYEELAAIYREIGQSAKAIEVLENALQAVEEKVLALKSLIRLAHEAQNLSKLRAYFEQLIALSGKPSVFEYERLGSLCAQLGEPEKAKAAWDKILEIAPKDTRVIKRLIGTMRDEGFAEEALALKAKAVELAPYDYRSRFEYAQMLASADQPAQALQQLQKLLELGEGESLEKPAKGEKHVAALTRGQRAKTNPFLQVQAGRRSVVSSATSFSGSSPLLFASPASSFARASWQGTFTEFKPQVISYMASLARNSRGEDVGFVQPYRNRVKQHPDDLEAKRELLLVLLASEGADTLQLAEEILSAAPDDYDILQLVAQRYNAQRQTDKAIPLLEKLARADSPYRAQAVQSLIPIYFQNRQPETALASASQLLAEHPTEYAVLYPLASLMLRQGQTNFAKSIYERGLTIDPRYRRTFQNALAGLYRQTGEFEKAVAIYKELLFNPTPAAATGGGNASGLAVGLYNPMSIPPVTSSFGSSAVRRVPPTVMGSVDATTNSPLARLIDLRDRGQSTFDAVAELERVARGFKPDLSVAERGRAWEAARILFGYYLSMEKYGSVSNLLEVLRQAGKQDIEWFNVSIYLDQVRENTSGMVAQYYVLASLYPARAREAMIARTRAFNLAGRYEAAAQAIHELNEQPIPPREFMQLIQPIAASESKATKPLLEEYLAAGHRDSEVLALLARICARERDYARAIELATEAWEHRPPSRNSSQTIAGTRIVSSVSGGVSYVSGSPASTGEVLVRELYNYHSAVGRAAELIEKFRLRLEKQPASIQLHETLAQLYSMANQRDQALEVYRDLAAKFPHLTQAKMAIAKLLTDKGDYGKAVEIYESLLKSHPESASQINSLLQNARQRAGNR